MGVATKYINIIFLVDFCKNISKQKPKEVEKSLYDIAFIYSICSINTSGAGKRILLIECRLLPEDVAVGNSLDGLVEKYYEWINNCNSL